MNIENLANIISVAAKLGTIAGASFDDGKISVMDVVRLPDLAMLFVQLIKTDWTQIIPEAKDMDEEERRFLINQFKREFDLPNDKLELRIEVILETLNQFSGIVGKFINLVKK